MHAGKPVRSWPVTPVGSLTTARARDLAERDGPRDDLLIIDRGSPGALDVLREAGASFATLGGELHLVDLPRLLVVHPASREVPVPANSGRPLSKATSRVARWLLLHPHASGVTIGQLARETTISDAASSRAVAQLADRGLVQVATSSDARQRLVSVRNGDGLLDAVADEGPWRRARHVTWDVGARTVEQALDLVRTADAETNLPYRVGGLAGAALIEPLVEPTTVTLWLPRATVEAWRQTLMGEPSRPATGRVTAHLAPDPVILSWGTSLDGLRIADDVQLYIDCRHAGERALDISEAMRQRVLRGP